MLWVERYVPHEALVQPPTLATYQELNDTLSAYRLARHHHHFPFLQQFAPSSNSVASPELATKDEEKDESEDNNDMKMMDANDDSLPIKKKNSLPEPKVDDMAFQNWESAIVWDGGGAMQTSPSSTDLMAETTRTIDTSLQAKERNRNHLVDDLVWENFIVFDRQDVKGNIMPAFIHKTDPRMMIEPIDSDFTSSSLISHHPKSSKKQHVIFFSCVQRTFGSLFIKKKIDRHFD